MKILLWLTVLAISTGLSQAALIQFDLLGKGGAGLLSTNENGAIASTPGSGGEIGAGIIYDDVTKMLTINVGWGVGNGFTSLSGNATAGHIHGPTPSPPPASFTENMGVLIGLDAAPMVWNPAAANGSTTGSVAIPPANEAALLAGSLYINFHTTANSAGEIRGNLIRVIPEPAIGMLGLFGAALLGLRRRNA
jgi:CHRD domain